MSGAPNGIGTPAQVTAQDTRFGRLKVEQGTAAFFQQRAFRAFFEFTVATSSFQVLKFSAPINFFLKSQQCSVDTGGIRVTANVSVTPSGTYTPFTAFGVNRSSPLLGYSQQCIVSAGVAGVSTFTGGTVTEVLRVRSANATAQTITVGGDQGTTGRFLPAGDYYIKLEPLSGVTGSSTGVYSIEWEEYP